MNAFKNVINEPLQQEGMVNPSRGISGVFHSPLGSEHGALLEYWGSLSSCTRKLSLTTASSFGGISSELLKILEVCKS